LHTHGRHPRVNARARARANAGKLYLVACLAF